MAAIISLVAGDLEPDLPLTCALDGVAVDLTDALAIEMLWRKPDGTTSLVDLSEVDPEAGTVKYVWEAGDTDEVGTHLCRVVVTHANSDPQTFPSDGSWFSWVVVAAS